VNLAVGASFADYGKRGSITLRPLPPPSPHPLPHPLIPRRRGINRPILGRSSDGTGYPIQWSSLLLYAEGGHLPFPSVSTLHLRSICIYLCERYWGCRSSPYRLRPFLSLRAARGASDLAVDEGSWLIWG
jgi:hypothetical protein